MGFTPIVIKLLALEIRVDARLPETHLPETRMTETRMTETRMTETRLPESLNNYIF
jgi:hypothetical protein